jgi:pimeloyl-ACP methyl ester carboxylesterase
LNHDQLYSDSNQTDRGIVKYQRIIGARLKKGRNFLVIKTCNLKGNWQLIVGLTKQERGLALAEENAIDPILMNSVVGSHEPLHLRGDLLPAAKSIRYAILDREHSIERSGDLPLQRSVAISTYGLKENNLYYCRVTAGPTSIERPFYYGELEAGFARLNWEAKPYLKRSDKVSIDLEAQFERLEHLLQNESKKSEFWGQKIVWSISELEAGISQLSRGEETFLKNAGTHLRGYRSSVDGQVQNYWVHVPEKALRGGNPMPVVFALPFITQQPGPFVKSYYLAAFDEAERYRILGNEYGFAVVQLWGRGNFLGGTAIGNADVFETLSAIAADYPIDLHRVYLLGYCEGGRLALLLGEHYPARFAAISAVAPITTLLPGKRYHDDAWARLGSPSTAVESLSNTPIFILHDRADNEPPFEQTRDFVAKCRNNGVSVTLKEPIGGFHGFYQNPTAEKRELFEFFRGKRKAIRPDKNRYLADLNWLHRPGPIEEAFGGTFLAVQGTGSEVAAKMMDEFLNDWRTAFFAACPKKLDVDVTEADIQQSNLVVIGDVSQKSALRQMVTSLPVHIGPGGISVKNHAYGGDYIGYEAIFPNPVNGDRYIVLVNANSSSYPATWKLHLSRDGIWDYAVFDLRGRFARLSDAGYFDGFLPNSSMAVHR